MSTKPHAFAYNILLALVSALLWGSSIPALKVFVGEVNAVLMAGLLYLGSGIALGLVLIMRQFAGKFKEGNHKEAQLERTDLPWFISSIFSGGVAAPICLMQGLSLTPAAVSSLFLNFEGIMTIVWGRLFFGEYLGNRIWLIMTLLFVGGLLLSSPAGGLIAWNIAGPFLLIMACALWGLDNNLTRNISGKDPVALTCYKGLLGGTATTTIALLNKALLPQYSSLVIILAIGAVCSGVSLVLFIYALRHLGVARTSACFGMFPFLGAILSVMFLHETLTTPLILAAVIMALAIIVLLSEKHAHTHIHENISHNHLHTSDDHHIHLHDGTEKTEPHSHWHIHETLLHEHDHMPDIHHRHLH